MQYQRNHTVTQTDVTFMDTFRLQILYQGGDLFRSIISFRRRRQPMEITMLDASGAMEYQMRYKVIEYYYFSCQIVILYIYMTIYLHLLQFDFSNRRN